MPRADAVLALFGPTGVGKTAVALGVSAQLRARGEDPVAVSVDAMQVYAGLPILTGAATVAEQARLEHRLLGHVPVDESHDVARHAADAHAEIDGLLEAGRRPIVVGGTGLYLRAALAELDLRPPPEAGVREALQARVAQEGSARLHAELATLEPAAASAIDPRDAKRVVRALELHAAGATPPPHGGGQLWTRETRQPTCLVGLVGDRDALRARIDARIDAMLEAGVEAEVRAANAAGASATARKAIGFEELLVGDVDRMRQRTRAYARRQGTWLRKLPDIAIVDVTGREADDVAAEVVAIMARP